MNIFKYTTYGFIKKLNRITYNVGLRLQNSCNHQYPNKKTAIDDGIFFASCSICGSKWLNSKTQKELIKKYQELKRL